MILDVGIVVDHAPRLFLKVQSPAEPSEKLAVSGMVGSLMIVAHPLSARVIVNIGIFFILHSQKISSLVEGYMGDFAGRFSL
jgi:hypothetical protein